jgi:hypothetical protein
VLASILLFFSLILQKSIVDINCKQGFEKRNETKQKFRNETKKKSKAKKQNEAKRNERKKIEKRNDNKNNP